MCAELWFVRWNLSSGRRRNWEFFFAKLCQWQNGRVRSNSTSDKSCTTKNEPLFAVCTATLSIRKSSNSSADGDVASLLQRNAWQEQALNFTKVLLNIGKGRRWSRTICAQSFDSWNGTYLAGDDGTGNFSSQSCANGEMAEYKQTVLWKKLVQRSTGLCSLFAL